MYKIAPHINIINALKKQINIYTQKDTLSQKQHKNEITMAEV